MAGIEVHIPYVNFKTKVQGFPRRVSGQAETVSIQQNLQYMGKKIKMIPSIQPLNTVDNIQWSIVEGGSYANINSSTGELTINNNTITQMIKVKATSLTNSSIFDEREIVLTYKDVDEIDLPVYQIIVTGLEDEYVYVNNEMTYTLKFSEYPGTIGDLFFDVIEGQNFINITDISRVENYTYITFSFMNIIDETNVIKLHVFDYGDNTIQTTVNITVKAKVQNIGFRNIPNGNIIPDIVYSFDYYTDPVLQRSMDVSIVQNNNLIDRYYLSNVNGTAGTINFVRKNEEIAQNQDVVFRVSDAQDLTNYRDASIVFAPINSHRIEVYDNLPVYEYEPSTNVYYSFRWQEVPTVERELSVQVIEPSTGSITYNLTDVSFGSGKFNFRPNSVNDIGNFTVKIYDEDNTNFYTDVNFLVHNTVELYNTRIIIGNPLKAGDHLYSSIDSINYNNYGENFFGEDDNNIPNFANTQTYNIINIKKYFGNIFHANNKVENVDKKIQLIMYFETNNQFFDTVDIEVISRNNISDSYYIYTHNNYLNTFYSSPVNGNNIQIKFRISISTGEYKIYEVNVQFIDLSNTIKLYITDNIREANNLSNILMCGIDYYFARPFYVSSIGMQYLYDVDSMYITLQNDINDINIDDYICIAASQLPLNNGQNAINGAFVLDKENNRFIFNVNDLKNYIKQNNQELYNPEAFGSAWISWAYDTDGHYKYDDRAEHSYNNGRGGITLNFLLYDKNSISITNRFIYQFDINLNGQSQIDYIKPLEMFFRKNITLSTTKNALQNTNVISIRHLYCCDLCNRTITGNLPNNIFTGNMIFKNYENGKITKIKKMQVSSGNTLTFNKSYLQDFNGDIKILIKCNYNLGIEAIINSQLLDKDN